jgi:hypothetical protein
MEFGKVQTSLDFYEKWHKEDAESLKRIEQEILKLTGNGNKGKIDILSDHVARLEASQHRIERLEKATEELEDRIYTTSLKVAGAIGLVTIIAHYLLSAAGL